MRQMQVLSPELHAASTFDKTSDPAHPSTIDFSTAVVRVDTLLCLRRICHSYLVSQPQICQMPLNFIFEF